MKNKPVLAPFKPRRRINYGRIIHDVPHDIVACFTRTLLQQQPSEKSEESMKDVYNQILLISTVAAVVEVPTVLLIMNFSNVFGNKLLFPSKYLSFCRKSPFHFSFCFSCLVFVSSRSKPYSFFVFVSSHNSLLNLIIAFNHYTKRNRKAFRIGI